MKTVRIEGLPDEPLAAAGLVHQHWLARIEHALAGSSDVLVALDPADHTHRDWRRALARDLARKHAPRRVNVVAGEADVVRMFLQYLEDAPGVTGQYFEGDGHGAGDPTQ